MTSQLVTIGQLARLYEARNKANSNLASSIKSGDAGRIANTKAESRRLNMAYEDARRQYKRQQKAEHREQLRTTMIRFYLDAAQ